MDTRCELCQKPGGTLLWEDARCRVVQIGGADGAAFPGFCRVIWNSHVAEMSDLPTADAEHLLKVILAVERAQREVLDVAKINLASLGNVVPHLHWHVIPRWRDDSRFPQPIWAPATRDSQVPPPPGLALLAAAVVRHCLAIGSSAL